MKNKTIFKLFFIISMLFFFSCNNDTLLFKKDKNFNSETFKNQLPGILQVSYEVTTWTDYETPFSKLSDLDISNLNPMSEKQKITMQLSESGEVSLTIDKLNFKNKIKIPNNTPANDIPEIVRTEIIGNTAYFYDKSKKLKGSEHIEIPNQIKLVEKIKKLRDKFSEEDINEALATMQGQFFADNTEEFIKNASENGAEIQELEDGYITVRMPLKDMGQNLETVLLINKNINKLVGNRIYNEKNELLQTVYYGYNKGKIQSLNAVRVEEKISLPSGKEIKMTTNSKIENLKFNLNI